MAKEAVGCFGLLIIVAALFLSVRTISPGQVGLPVTLGSVSNNVLGAGIHVTNPIAAVKKFNIQTTLFEMSNHVPTKEGLIVDLDVALLFHVDKEKVRNLYLTTGEKFVTTIIAPELASAVRGLTSEADAKALYTSGRSEIQRKLKDDLKRVFAPRGIVLEDVLLKAIVLPMQLTRAIEMKAQAEQEANRMQFILDKERQEAERKTIEAHGIAEFQRIVSQGLSPGLLQWKGIEATTQLAQSKNSKIVIMGNSRGDLPVILSGDVPSRRPRGKQEN